LDDTKEAAAIPPAPDFESVFREVIFGRDEAISKQFLEHFSGYAKEFHTQITIAANVWLAFQRVAGDRKDLAYTSGYFLNCINCAAISVKLLLNGYLVPSGNLCRNAIESLAIAILISVPETRCFELLMEGKEFAHQSVYLLQKHAALVGVKPEAIGSLITNYKFFHQYSHSSLLSLSSVIISPEASNIGAVFVGDRLDGYTTELENRINLAKLITNGIAGLHTFLGLPVPEKSEETREPVRTAQ
jgi:hypothetical protein